MQISWNGLSCFEILVKTSEGEVRIVTDPFAPETGLKLSRALEADVVTTSHDEDDANHVASVGGTPFVIKNPGEYEVKGVFVYGTGIARKDAKAGENLIVRIEAEDMVLAHLGALDRDLTDAEVEALSNVDILMLPVGGGSVIDPKTASEVIAQVEPRVVIPMMHATEGMKAKAAPVADFCKAVGVCRRVDATTYKVSRKDLPEEETVIAVLSR
jgi:L-ascorbate metabolism protein UlaG (beta-lactamase superfamily)